MRDILVDTSIWSLYFRRKNSNREGDVLEDLLHHDRVRMIGPIRQEFLSGIKDEKVFDQLRSQVDVILDYKIRKSEYVLAARFFNQCRSKGIQGSHIDFLICAVANSNDMPIFTTDKDFSLYAEHLPISLYQY